jgi:hypothetical protein
MLGAMNQPQQMSDADRLATSKGFNKLQNTSIDVYKKRLANGKTYYSDSPQQGLPRAGAGQVSAQNMREMDNLIARQNGLVPQEYYQPAQMQQQQGYQLAPVRSNVLPDWQANQQMQRTIQGLMNNIADVGGSDNAGLAKAKYSQHLLDGLLNFDVNGKQRPQLEQQKMGMDDSQFGSTMRNRQNEFGQTNALEQQRQGLMDRKNYFDYQQALAGLGIQGMREQRAMEAQQQKSVQDNRRNAEQAVMMKDENGRDYPVRYLRDSDGNITGYEPIQQKSSPLDAYGLQTQMQKMLSAGIPSTDPAYIQLEQQYKSLNKKG